MISRRLDVNGLMKTSGYEQLWRLASHFDKVETVVHHDFDEFSTVFFDVKQLIKLAQKVFYDWLSRCLDVFVALSVTVSCF